MKVIIFRDPKGRCSVVRPAPEMFNPNSRTIREMENAGKIFPAVEKVLTIEYAKCEGIKTRIQEAGAELASMARLLTSSVAEEKEKSGALAKVETLKAEIRECELMVVASVASALGDRTAHPDFDMDSFVESAWAYIVAKAVPIGVEWKFAEDSELPDREYRNAWRVDDIGTLVIDMEAARELHRDHMRQCRRQLLADLDVQYQRADEREAVGEKAEIAAQKQALRDVTKLPAIDEAKTPEELKKAWPEYLGVRSVL